MRALVAIAVVLLGIHPVHATQLPNRIAMIPTSGGPNTPALPMLDSKIELTVRGPIVEAVVTQTFKNDTDKATEATYIFPLPPDASVSAMSITTGQKTIHAAIEKRADAQKRYEAAVAAGQRAASLEQERPDVFTQTVSAIPPRGTVAVTIRFDTIARYRTNGQWELAVPLVVAPRFVPGTASGRPTTGVGRAPDTDRAPDASRVTPNGAPGAGGKTEIAIAFDAAVTDVTSPSHALAGSAKAWKLVDPKSDHDAIVRWKAPALAAGWVEQGPDGAFAAIVVEAGPPAARKPGMVKTTLVIDRAATTRGDADAVMHPLVRAVFAKLDPADRIAVAGSDTVASTSPGSAAASVEKAWTKAAGPFDLTRVLAALRVEGSAVVLVSDGLVADDAAAIAAAQKLGVPVHVLGVGPAPNRSLLGAIAAATNGTIRFASTADNLTEVAREVITDIANPPGPPAITWGTLGASDLAPAALPRLGTGQAMLVLARVKAPSTANGRASSAVFGMQLIATQRAVPGATSARGVLARRWARERLDELIAKRDATAAANHALQYGLVSPYTTMVAIGDEVVVEGGVKRSRPVPVSVPAGMKWQEVQKETRVQNIDKVTENKLTDRPKTEPAKKTGVAGRSPVAPTGGVVVPTQPSPPPQPVAQRPEREGVDDNFDSDGKRPRRANDGDSEDAGADEDNAPRDYASAPGSIQAEGTSVAARSDAADVEEMVELSSYDGGTSRLRTRLALSLGAGLVRGPETAGLVALDGRFEVGRANMVGIDAALWLVDGLNAQGRALLSVARRGLFQLVELGGGVGAHFGDGAGPAWSVSLRIRRHVFGLGGFIRYDGAYLYGNDANRVQNAGTIGLELTF